MKKSSSSYDKLLSSLVDVDRVSFWKSFTEVLQTYSPPEALDSYIVPVLDTIGKGWLGGSYSLSQLYMAGKICEEVIPPILEEHEIPKK